MTVTRIVSGFAGSLPLRVPAAGTRPTSDRVREAVFSSLQAMDAVGGIRVLDLFAGSGAIALEAVSRGAASAVLVERSAAAAAICRANAAAVARAAGSDGRSRPVPTIAVRAIAVASYLGSAGPSDRFGLVFIDPPYDLGEGELSEILTALLPLLNDDAVVVVERSSRSPEPAWPSGLEPLRSKGYGETVVWYAEPAQPSAPSQSA
jgi:16S rRNA (guanine966-N2)-methyltransferase